MHTSQIHIILYIYIYHIHYYIHAYICWSCSFCFTSYFCLTYPASLSFKLAHVGAPYLPKFGRIKGVNSLRSKMARRLENKGRRVAISSSSKRPIEETRCFLAKSDVSRSFGHDQRLTTRPLFTFLQLKPTATRCS